MEIMEDIDDELNDDLQMLGSFPTPQGTKGAHANIDCGSSTFNVSKSTSTRDDVEDVDDRDPKKGRAERSDVWKHFIRVDIADGVEKCRCKYCDKLYSCKAKSGTTSIKRHLEVCIEFPKSENVKNWKFDAKEYRDALARCIIKHDLSFSYVEYDGVNDLNKILNPQFKPVSRNTTKNDCMNVFLVEKQKLKSLLVAIPGRICLTSDCWTALTTQGYMTVTAHYVDENWKLNSKLLSFCELTSPHSGYELSRKLLGVLKDWGIELKIFTLTLDNATNCDNMVRFLKDRLNLQNGLLCQGEFFHVRCCAHILNLIVQEGLKVVDDALKKIRGSVKYVKASDGRLRQFHKCIEEVGLSDVGGSFLRLDVLTRWNSSYLMLESAIKYRLAFTSLSDYDTNYKHCPTDEEWERAERMHAFLEPFYEITKLLSGSSYPTSNLYFKQIAIIEGHLVDLMGSSDDVIKDMASRMKVKFDKYWDEYCGILAFGCILDPRSKLKMMSFCYEVLYPQDYEERVNKLKKSLYKLFSQYERVEVASITFLSSTLANPPPKRNMFEAFEHKLLEMNSNESELTTYLEEACIVGNTIDILEYWSMNKKRFPLLAKMVCDVLSIPVTTVASESTFSIGGRILNKYRNCLLPETVQALICTRNWLHGFKKTEDLDREVEVEEIELLEKDSNVLEFEE